MKLSKAQQILDKKHGTVAKTLLNGSIIMRHILKRKGVSPRYNHSRIVIFIYEPALVRVIGKWMRGKI